MPSDTFETNNITIQELLGNFLSGSLRQKLRLVEQIEARSEELTELGPKLVENFDKHSDDWSFGWILQVLNRHQKQFLSELMSQDPPQWFDTPSSVGIDHSFLQKSLLE